MTFLSSSLGKLQTHCASSSGYWVDALHPECGALGFQGYCGAWGRDCGQAK